MLGLFYHIKNNFKKQWIQADQLGDDLQQSGEETNWEIDVWSFW